GKYHNRGIIDGFGGVSRGREQWTVRGSRELDSAPEQAAIGAIRCEIAPPRDAPRVGRSRYDVARPLEQFLFILEPNDVQPISFDVVLSGVTPPFFENRNLVRNGRTNRGDVNVVRYHQGGWAS